MPTLMWGDEVVAGGATEAPKVAALGNGGFVVVWTAGSGADRDIYFQLYNAVGEAVGEPTLVVASVSAFHDPHVVATETGFAVVATQDFLNQGDDDTIGYRFGIDGVSLGSFIVDNSSTNDESGSDVALVFDTSLHVAWLDESGVRLRPFAVADGTAGTLWTVTSSTSVSDIQVTAALASNGSFREVVTWIEGGDLRVATIDANDGQR